MGIQQAVGAKVEKKEPESVKFIGHYFRQKELCTPIYIGFVCPKIMETSTILKRLSREK